MKDKRKRYEKVVEWKEKPEIGAIVFLILFVGAIIAINILTIVMPNHVSIFEIRAITISMDSILFILLVIAIIVKFSGEGRKVYWQEVKEKK